MMFFKWRYLSIVANEPSGCALFQSPKGIYEVPQHPEIGQFVVDDFGTLTQVKYTVSIFSVETLRIDDGFGHTVYQNFLAQI